jgi:hypothetical protein
MLVKGCKKKMMEFQTGLDDISIRFTGESSAESGLIVDTAGQSPLY